MEDFEESPAGQAPEAELKTSAAEDASLDAIGFAKVEFAKPDNSPDHQRNEELRTMAAGTFVVLASGDTLVRSLRSNRILSTFADLRGSGEVHAKLAKIGYQPAESETQARVQEIFDSGAAEGSIPLMEAEYISSDQIEPREA